MISSVCWVGRGMLKAVPQKYQPLDEELDKFATHLQQHGEDIEEEKAEMEQDQEQLLEEDDDLEDLENFVIRPTDGILVAATSDEEEYSHLDVYIFEEEADNLYVHHDMLLPAFPLSICFLDYPVRDSAPRKNLVAVGTMEPGIEIWDLDVVDSLEPKAVLGGVVDKEFDYPGMSKKQQELVPGSHSDAVLTIAWNNFFRNVMTSGSADCTVKFWDLAQLTCLHTYQHNNKVQALSWHPVESNILLGGSFGGQVSLFDVKNPKAITHLSVDSDIECLQWNPIQSHQFMVSTESGMMHCFDARDSSKPLYTFQAHKKAASAFAFNPAVNNFVASVSVDKKLKLWNLNEGEPVCLHKEDLNMGKLFSLSFYGDSPQQLAIGGSSPKPLIYDTSAVSGVADVFFPSASENGTTPTTPTPTPTTTTTTTTSAGGKKSKSKSKSK